MAGVQHGGGKFPKTADYGISMTVFSAAIILPHMAGVPKCLLWFTIFYFTYSALLCSNKIHYTTEYTKITHEWCCGVLFWYTGMQIDIGFVMVISFQQ